jgi:hypothetical protein
MAGNIPQRHEIFQLFAMLYADEEIILTEFIDKWKKIYPDDKEWTSEFTTRWNAAFPQGKWTKSESP